VNFESFCTNLFSAVHSPRKRFQRDNRDQTDRMNLSGDSLILARRGSSIVSTQSLSSCLWTHSAASL
jgi:hypothetical protein